MIILEAPTFVALAKGKQDELVIYLYFYSTLWLTIELKKTEYPVIEWLLDHAFTLPLVWISCYSWKRYAYARLSHTLPFTE